MYRYILDNFFLHRQGLRVPYIFCCLYSVRGVCTVLMRFGRMGDSFGLVCDFRVATAVLACLDISMGLGFRGSTLWLGGIRFLLVF